jgi:DNA-binding PadR family transcriptional regulator
MAKGDREGESAPDSRSTASVPALTDPGFQILLALADGERHGYEIMQILARAGLARIGPTTLYRTIRALQLSGLIEETEQRPDPANDDGRRRYYRLTAAGGLAARAELERLRRLVAVAETTSLAARGHPLAAT